MLHIMFCQHFSLPPQRKLPKIISLTYWKMILLCPNLWNFYTHVTCYKHVLHTCSAHVLGLVYLSLPKMNYIYHELLRITSRFSIYRNHFHRSIMLIDYNLTLYNATLTLYPAVHIIWLSITITTSIDSVNMKNNFTSREHIQLELTCSVKQLDRHYVLARLG